MNHPMRNSPVFVQADLLIWLEFFLSANADIRDYILETEVDPPNKQGSSLNNFFYIEVIIKYNKRRLVALFNFAKFIPFT